MLSGLLMLGVVDGRRSLTDHPACSSLHLPGKSGTICLKVYKEFAIYKLLFKSKKITTYNAA